MSKSLFFQMMTAACVLGATPAAAQAADDRPAMPDGFAGSFGVPARDAAGAYRTPNRDLSADQVVWHVRVALNVAALGCRGAGEAQTVAAYNALLQTEKAALAAADVAEQAGERARFGAEWQHHHDDDQTRLYNFWAQPPAQAGFCAVAEQVLREAAAVEPANFAGFAAQSLTRLEAPFVAAYATWDGYRAQLAAWQARHDAAAASAPATVVLAATAPVSVAPVAMQEAPVIAVPAFAPAVPTVAAPPVVTPATPPVLLASVAVPAPLVADRR